MNVKVKRLISIFILILGISSVAIVYAADATNYSTNDDDFVSGVIPVYTPGSGGILYIVNAGLTNIMNNSGNLPDVKMATESTSGSSEIAALSLDKARENKPYLAAISQPDIYRVYEGTHQYFQEEHPDLRAVAKLGYAAIHLIVSENSDIESFADLKGKTVGVGAGTAQEAYIIDLLSTGYGLEAGVDYELIPIGYQEVQQGIQDNSIDSGVLMGSVPAPLMQETVQTTDVRILSVDEEAQKKLEDKHPYYSFSTVEAGTYEGQDEDFVIGSIDLITYTHEDTPGILIEEYLNGILENREAFEQVHGTAKDINADTIAEDMLLPLHPAAEEYYKQAGIITE
jgi:hypothetical protein